MLHLSAIIPLLLCYEGLMGKPRPDKNVQTHEWATIKLPLPRFYRVDGSPSGAFGPARKRNESQELLRGGYRGLPATVENLEPFDVARLQCLPQMHDVVLLIDPDRLPTRGPDRDLVTAWKRKTVSIGRFVVFLIGGGSHAMTTYASLWPSTLGEHTPYRTHRLPRLNQSSCSLAPTTRWWARRIAAHIISTERKMTSAWSHTRQ